MAVKTAETRTVATNTAKTTISATAETMTKPSERVPAPTKRALGVFNAPSDTDVNGSYTGRPKNEREKPVQDADDL